MKTKKALRWMQMVPSNNGIYIGINIGLYMTIRNYPLYSDDGTCNLHASIGTHRTTDTTIK